MNNISNSNFSTNSQKPVAAERTGWRDEWISSQHRKFGWDCPFLDIDFLGLEYDQGKPVCLVEYKHYFAKVRLSHPSILALKYLADQSQLPFFVVFYYPESYNYFVVAVNSLAQKVLGGENKLFSERNFVRLLYHLRKKQVPQEILDQLKTNNNLPAELELPIFQP